MLILKSIGEKKNSIYCFFSVVWQSSDQSISPYHVIIIHLFPFQLCLQKRISDINELFPFHFFQLGCSTCRLIFTLGQNWHRKTWIFQTCPLQAPWCRAIFFPNYYSSSALTDYSSNFLHCFFLSLQTENSSCFYTLHPHPNAIGFSIL